MEPDAKKSDTGQFTENSPPFARSPHGFLAPHQGHLYAPLVYDRIVCPTIWSNL